MKFFLDSADIEEIFEIYQLGIIDGVTTNPSLISKTNKDFKQIVVEICKIVDGDVSIEVVAHDFAGMIEQSEKILSISNNIVIKLPMTWDGLRACKILAEQSVKVNMTLCFSANQALLAAKVGAYYISPFIGRLDDIGSDGMNLISEIRQIYDRQSFSTKILAASVRNANHISESAILGADVVTIGGKLMKTLLDHPLTEKGLGIFDKDWLQSGLAI